MLTEFPQLQVMQQLGRTYRAMLSAFIANTGQPMPRWRILLTVHQLGELSQKQLATVLPMDPAALTRQLKPMEQLGWIERHTDALDNRLTNVALTQAGLAIVEQVLPRRSLFIEKAFSDFSLDEMDTLSRLLSTLESRLRLESQGNLDGPDKI